MSAAIKLLHIIYGLADIFGLNALFRFFNRDKAVILWYHGVCDDSFKLLKGYDERHIPISVFRRQLEYLKKKGYRFATLTDLHQMMVSGENVGRVVVLTFDDGFRNVIKNAYPLLREYNARGCFYLVHNLIGSNDLLWTDLVETAVRNCKEKHFILNLDQSAIEYKIDSRKNREKAMRDIKKLLRTLDDTERKRYIARFRTSVNGGAPEEFKFAGWDEIKSLDSRILEIGSHTLNHPNLPKLGSDEEFTSEIIMSKAEIEKKLGRQVEHFCYPAGAYDERTVEYVKNSGYKTAVSTLPGLEQAGGDNFMLRRLVVTESFTAFKAYISGFYLFLRKFAKKT